MKNMIFKFFYVLLFLFASSFRLSSQLPDQSKVDSVKNYLENINKSELYICENNYNEAIKLYKNAFSFNYSPFPEDIFNYILLNVYEKDYDEALFYSQYLVKLGAELKFFDQIPLNELKSNVPGWKKFTDLYPSLRMHYTLNTNHTLKQELLNLQEADQNNYCGRPTRPFDPISEDTIFNRISQIITEYGYPNHDKIGINLNKDTIIGSYPQDVILIHLFQTAHKNSKRISELIKNEILEGRLKPEYAILWLDYFYQDLSFYGFSKFQLINKDIYFDEYNFEISNYKWFENNRRKIFASSFRDALIKRYYKIKNPNSKFIFQSLGIVINNYASNSKETTLSDRFAHIEKLDSTFNNFLPDDDFMDSVYTIKHNFINEPYKYYYKLINNAELSICDQDYNKAIEQYLYAFKIIDIPFPKDIFNLMLCSIYEEKYKIAAKYGKLMISLGADLKFFDQIPLNKIKLHEKFWKNIVKSFPKLHKEYLSKTDLKLKKQFENLYKDFNNVLNSKDFLKEINETDIFSKYTDIIRKNGYPGFRKIGINTIGDTSLIGFDNIISYYYGYKKDTAGISDILLSDVFKGNISATQYLLYNNYYNKTDYKFGTPVLCKYYGDQYYVLDTNNEENKRQINRINNNRANTLNCSLEEELKKLIFIKKHMALKFKFELSSSHRIYSVTPYQQTDIYKKINMDNH
ncbi:MAG: hypothetical protein IPH57_11120 [Saprospiraceae bacterium]|nr:hypothetical protein [Saprospiraceae bacterium]